MSTLALCRKRHHNRPYSRCEWSEESRQVNDDTGFSIVAPITNTVRGMALEIPLQGTATNGVVLMYQLRSLGVASRNARFVEKVPTSIINKAKEIAITVIP